MLGQRLRPSLHSSCANLRPGNLALRQKHVSASSPLLRRLPLRPRAPVAAHAAATASRTSGPSALTGPHIRTRSLASAGPGADKLPLKQRSRIVRGLYRTFFYVGAGGVTLSALVVGFFLYDASTYKEDAEKYDLGVSELALNPRIGGPKNLPIAEVLVSKVGVFIRYKTDFNLGG